MKLIVVGSGASGIVSGIFAKKNGYDVTILERNSSSLKKLLITGNGRCNYFNEDFNLKHFYSDNLDILDKIITNKNINSILEFFNSIGIVPNIKNGYYYPYSNQALSVKEALVLEAKLCGIDFIYDTFVNDIEKIDDKFVIYTSNGIYKCDKVILSTGSRAYPKTGSDGNGYNLAKKLGHTVNEIFPSLVQIEGEGAYLKKWEGVRCSAIVSLYDDGKLLKQEEGELQLTNYGISGICVFNISGLVSKNLLLRKNMVVKINFMPFINSCDSFIKWFDERNKKVLNRTIKEQLNCILNYKLVNTILSICKINDNAFWKDLDFNKKNLLAKSITSFDFKVRSTKGFDSSQVCMGGVILSEINPYTMESLLVKNLYLTGEILDVCGDCGGYNLGFAFISGMLAGLGVSSYD